LKATFGLKNSCTPLDIFQKFIDEGMVENICTETNSFSAELKLRKPGILKSWKELEVEEFWRWIALCTLMGIVKKSNLKDYWSTNKLISTAIFGETMSRNR